MARQNIILTGFMGTGKSTIGQLLARELDYEFVDTDQLIEARVGKTIAQLFEDDGEAEFRRLEAELALELAGRQGLVIATGGGLMTNPVNVAALEGTGKIFCLTATPEEIRQRVSQQSHARPLLAHPDPLRKITELLDQRAASYGRFPQVSTSGVSQQQVVTTLQELTKQAPHPKKRGL